VVNRTKNGRSSCPPASRSPNRGLFDVLRTQAEQFESTDPSPSRIIRWYVQQPMQSPQDQFQQSALEATSLGVHVPIRYAPNLGHSSTESDSRSLHVRENPLNTSRGDLGCETIL
jgi:hypothetical protein